MVAVDTIGGNASVDVVVVVRVVAVVVVAWCSSISPLRSTWCVPVWCVPVLTNSTSLFGAPVQACLCALDESLLCRVCLLPIHS